MRRRTKKKTGQLNGGTIYLCKFQFSSPYQNVEDEWAAVALQISAVLSVDTFSLPEEDHPLPFDAASDKPLDDQK